MRKVIRRTDDVSGDVRGERGDAQCYKRRDQYGGVVESCEHIHWIPERLFEDDCRRRSHRHADERVQRHRGWQSQHLAEHLIALGFGVTRKVRDVQRERGPESNHASERGEKEFPKLAFLRLTDVKRRGLREHRTESARLTPRPPEQQQSQRDEQWGFDVQQKANGINAAIDDVHVDAPKQHEAGELAGVDAEPIRGGSGMKFKQRANNFVDRIATDPCLDTEPTTRHQRAQHGGNIRTERTKRGAAINWERNPVARSSVSVEDHGDEYDQVAEEDGEYSLPPIHAAADERRREHVSGDARGHGNPQRSKATNAPLALRG